jgi:glucose-6-phosphate dehydrogenase assembly protein OpcA
MNIHPELGQEVAVGNIEKELAVLWSQENDRANASIMNLVIYSEKKDSLCENSRIIKNLTREHACRGILIEMDRAANDTSIRAWITAHCHINQGKKSICCEQISFALTGVSQGRLRNTVFAHLLGDLPLIFWWQGELSSIFDERLYSEINRFVFDSSDWKDPAASFEILQSAIDSAGNHLVIQDLVWTRTYQFRLAVATLFDDPLAQQSLSKIASVDISYGKGHQSAALQLLAWLIAQTGWRRGLELNLATTHQQGNKRGFSYENTGGNQIDITLEELDQSTPLIELLIQGENMTLSITHKKDSAHLYLRLEIGTHITETISPLGPEKIDALVAQQLSRGGKNSLFMKVLPVLKSLLQ